MVRSLKLSVRASTGAEWRKGWRAKPRRVDVSNVEFLMHDAKRCHYILNVDQTQINDIHYI